MIGRSLYRNLGALAAMALAGLGLAAPLPGLGPIGPEREKDAAPRELTDSDRRDLAAAQAKRDRKNARRLAER